MITKAYIQEYGNHKIEPEHSDLKTVLESRGVDCTLFTAKRLLRNQLPTDRQTLIAGDHATISTVLKKLGIQLSTSCYPQSLKKYLKRNIRETTLQKLMMQKNEEPLNIFIKPKSKTKLFTGFVLYSQHDLFRLDNFSKYTELYYLPALKWVSEYRIFVSKSQIVGIRHYSGDENIKPDMNLVKNVVDDFENSDERTEGYGIDFGILKNGETALVEWNDGFALGSYHLDKEIYTDLILNRWEEILKTSFD